MKNKDIDKDLYLKSKMHSILEGMGYLCKIKYDSPERILKDKATKKDLLELDGAYYDVASQCMIYFEATTQGQDLSQKVILKHNQLCLHTEEVEYNLGLFSKVEKRRFIFLSNKKPQGKDLEKLDSMVKVIYVDSNELEYYYIYLFEKIGKYLKYEFNKLLDISQKEKPRMISAIKINMSGKTIYLFELSVDEVLKTSYVVRKKDLLDGGYQRILDDKKLKEINNFLEKGQSYSIFPNSILLNLNNKIIEIGNTNDDNIIQLKFPIDSGLYHIIDGQHRVYGYCKSSIPLDQARLIIAGLQNSTPDEERRFFLKINKTQKKIDPTLLNLLLAQTNFIDDEDEYWESIASKLVLEMDKEGIYKNKIYKGAYLERKKKDQKATLSYMVDKIKKTKLLAHRKKEKGQIIIKDGLLQKKGEKDLSKPLKKLGTITEEIIKNSEEDPEIRNFFSSNRGFDLICRLVKGYFKLKKKNKKFNLSFEEYTQKLFFSKEIIIKFKSLYGTGGMVKISELTQKELNKVKALKNLKLTN